MYYRSIERYISITIVLIVLSSCSSSDKSASVEENVITPTTNHTQTISVNIDAEASLKMSKIFSEIRYMKLSTPGERMIGKIQKIIFEDDRIFIFETGNPSIFIFTTRGEFVRQIHIPEGKGPGEVMNPSDFVVHPADGHISVLGDFRINRYAYTGQVVREYTLKILPSTFTVLANGDYVLYMDNNTFSNGKVKNFGHNLIYMTPEGDIYGQALPIKKSRAMMGFGVSSNFPKSGSSRLFFGYPSYKIYELGTNSIEVKYYLDFGEHAIPESLYDERTDFNDGIAFSQKTFENGYASHLGYFHELDQLLYVNFYTANAPPWALFYLKGPDRSIVTENLINDMDLGKSPVTFNAKYNSQLVEVAQPAELIKQAKETKQQLSEAELKRYRQREQNLFDLTEGMSPMDNPVLMFCKVKNHYKSHF